MNIRKLKCPDIFEGCRLLKVIGVKDHIAQSIKKVEENTDLSKDYVGFDIIWDIFDAATEKDAEKEIYKFLSGPFQITPEEVENLEATELFEGIKQLVKENDLAIFFKRVASLTK